jgi:MBG domain (YGX type)/YDG domain
VTGITASDKIYDSTNSATVDVSNAIFTGLVSGDDVSVSASGTFSSKTVGTSKTVTLVSTYSGNDYLNYAITSQSTTAASISKATLSLSGSTGVTRAYTGTNAMAAGTTGYGTLTGLLGSDSVTVTGSPIFAGTNVGSYAIQQGTVALAGTDAANYNLNWANGNGSITQALLTVTADNKSRAYGSANPSLSQSISGFVNGETALSLGLSVPLATTTASTSTGIGTYTITASLGALNSSNYSFQAVEWQRYHHACIAECYG